MKALVSSRSGQQQRQLLVRSINPARCPIIVPSYVQTSRKCVRPKHTSRALPPLLQVSWRRKFEQHVSNTRDTKEAFSSLLLPSPGLACGTIFNTAVFVTGIQVLLRGLTWSGVLNAWLLGTLVFSAFGWGGYALVCLYFLFGTAVRRVSCVTLLHAPPHR